MWFNKENLLDYLQESGLDFTSPATDVYDVAWTYFGEEAAEYAIEYWLE